MAWLTPDEFAARTKAKEAAARAAYTWKNATTDLTHSTRLTLVESVRVIEEFRRSNVHPYDALPIMIRVFNTGFDLSDISGLARAVVDLTRLERTLDEGNEGS